MASAHTLCDLADGTAFTHGDQGKKTSAWTRLGSLLSSNGFRWDGSADTDDERWLMGFRIRWGVLWYNYYCYGYAANAPTAHDVAWAVNTDVVVGMPVQELARLNGADFGHGPVYPDLILTLPEVVINFGR